VLDRDCEPCGLTNKANRHRVANLDLCRRLIETVRQSSTPVSTSPPEIKDWKDRYRSLTGIDPDLCPACNEGRLVCVDTLAPLASKGLPRQTPRDNQLYLDSLPREVILKDSPNI
jgi:hypothetical protein